MKNFCIVFAMLLIFMPATAPAKAKRSFTINEFNMELDALARKYGKMAIDNDLRTRENKFASLRESTKNQKDSEKYQAIQTSIDRHSYIGKEVEIINLFLNETENRILRFRDETSEGRVAVYYKSNQKSVIKRQILKNPSQKFAVTGKFIRVGKDGIEMDFVSVKVVH